jgi:uncharacterized membrane protein
MQVLTSEIRTPNVHPVERWISVAGGALLAANGMRRGRKGIFEMVTGALMVRRGLTGKCEVYRALGMRTTPWEATLPYELGIRARSSITIAQPRETVYLFWRQLENLPKFMQHLLNVEPRGEKRSHWVVEGPMGKKFSWDAEIINEIPNELIAWKSLPGADVDSAGSVRFSDAPGERGTQVQVELQYNPPAGVAGAYLAKIFGREPEQQIDADLRRLKQVLETGEIASTTGQPKGDRHAILSEKSMPEHVIEEAFT